MVTIKNYENRINDDGKEFFVLILEGDLELAQSTKTGKYYATAKQTSITSTFNELTCKALIGKTLPGSINKVACESFTYLDKLTGETTELTHRYVYSPNATATVEEAVFQQEMIKA